MIPRLNIQFPLKRQWQFWFGRQYEPNEGEYLLNHARTGIILALRASLPGGGRVGVVAYNCHTVANAVVNAGCTPIFVDVTDELKIDVVTIPADLDAIVVTNLFGIKNDISAVRKRCPQAIIIVDNAHGYGLPPEGDFTVYSINQGKFPALGEGGILKVAPSISNFRLQIFDLYAKLPAYTILAQVKLFCSMIMKAIAYSRCVYWLVQREKKKVVVNPLQEIAMYSMAPGIKRLYAAALPKIDAEIEMQKSNAERIKELAVGQLVDEWPEGNNAFMLVARTENVQELKEWFAKQGIETETHFKHAIDWAKEFGYIPGSCPTAERLTKELLMIPTYKKI
ncbi:MAG: DegT/DnrJ/EryC1/StrS family aminotransferase [Paludibacteraceae bacterium]|nr:DegT/DnrJ/EryC1/StrS family aminotransferase [Paludibacteraceae bacterium]